MNRLNTITRILNQIKNGVFTRFGFETQVPVKANIKDNISITKTTFITGRTGVNYNNLKAVKERENKSTIKRTNNYSWIINNKLKYNSNTDKFYLQVATNKHNNVKSFYTIHKDGKFFICATKNQLQKRFGEYCLNSYFTNNKEQSPVLTVNIDNIIKVNNIWLNNEI